MLQDTVILRNFPDQTDKNHTISFIYGKVDCECPLYYIMYFIIVFLFHNVNKTFKKSRMLDDRLIFVMSASIVRFRECV